MSMSRTDAAFRRLQWGLAAVMTIYRGSDGAATRLLYAELETRGPAGLVALNVLRAVKCSERAKQYRGRGYKDAAYDRKQWSLENLVRELEAHGEELGIRWGWGHDPAQPFHAIVLYVDLPDVGQVSFHTNRRCGDLERDYPGQWDGQRGAAPSRACSFAVRVLELAPLATSSPPAATVGPVA